MVNQRIKKLEDAIADLKGRQPKHSVKPSMHLELEEFKEQPEKTKKEAEAGK